jgi:hypothetical protein
MIPMLALLEPKSVGILLTDEQRARIKATWSGYKPAQYEVLQVKEQRELVINQYKVIDAIMAENPAAFREDAVLDPKYRWGASKAKKEEVLDEA